MARERLAMKAKEVAGEAGEQAKQVATEVKEQARQVAGDVKEQAQGSRRRRRGPKFARRPMKAPSGWPVAFGPSGSSCKR